MNATTVLLLAVVSQPEPAPGAFEFVRPEGLPHIALQRFPDYHRIRCFVRIQRLAGRKAFGRLIVDQPTGTGTGAMEPNSEQTMRSVQTYTFDVEADNAVYAIYFRAPRFNTQNAEYTVLFGEFKPLEAQQSLVSPEEHFAQTGFRWVVARQPTRIVSEENGQPLPVIVPVRILVVQGGEVRVVSEVRAIAAPLDFRHENGPVQPIDARELIKTMN